MACWQMCYRGALGESLLHVLIICDTKVCFDKQTDLFKRYSRYEIKPLCYFFQIHTRLARTLVKCYPKLSLDVVEGEEYLGKESLSYAPYLLQCHLQLGRNYSKVIEIPQEPAPYTWPLRTATTSWFKT